jgi:hypothetical protein
MPKATPRNEAALEEQAMLIASEIFNRINQYTNDSPISKFFLTDEIATSCYSLAGGFSSMIYTPTLAPEDIEDTTILSFIYALMTYGFNIYLKEHSMLTNAAPYSLPSNKKHIKKIQEHTLHMIEDESLTSTPLADKIIEILLTNISANVDFSDFILKGHRFNKKKFEDYSKLSLYWGYNFSRELLTK